jgi:hypothetical protein
MILSQDEYAAIKDRVSVADANSPEMRPGAGAITFAWPKPEGRVSIEADLSLAEHSQHVCYEENEQYGA